MAPEYSLRRLFHWDRDVMTRKSSCQLTGFTCDAFGFMDSPLTFVPVPVSVPEV